MGDINGRALAGLEVEVRGLREDVQQLGTSVSKLLDDHEMRIRVTERDLIGVQQKQSILAGIQAIFTMLASIAAAVVGSKP